MKNFIAYLSLFLSTGTLFCCALPSLLVVLGMGATMAGIVTNIPQVVWFSQYKEWVFALSGLMLLCSGALQWRSKDESCPVDREKAEACKSGKVWSKRILFFSAIVWLVGAFFAFIAPLIFFH